MRVIFTPMGMVRKFSAGLLTFLLVCSLSVIHPSFGAGGRTPVYAKNGMVSSASMLASEVVLARFKPVGMPWMRRSPRRSHWP